MPEVTSTTPPNSPTDPAAAAPVLMAPNPSAILGVDPEPAPAPVPAPVVPSEPVPKQVTLTEEQHADLLRKGQAFDAIEADPGLAQTVGDHFRRLASGNPAAAAAAEPEPVEDEVSLTQFPEFAALVKQNKELTELVQRQAAQTASQQLLAAHPDARQYEKRIVELVNQNGHTLDDAYRIAKATAKPAPAPAPLPAPQPLAEIGGPGFSPNDPGEPGDVLKKAAAIIDNPNASVRIGDAAQIAFDAATQYHANQ